MITFQQADLRVHAGIEYLNVVCSNEVFEYPWWSKKWGKDRIRPSKIDVSFTHLCPLGQLFGSYSEGIDALGLSEVGHHALMIALGFSPNNDDETDILNEVWDDEIRALRVKNGE